MTNIINVREVEYPELQKYLKHKEATYTLEITDYAIGRTWYTKKGAIIASSQYTHSGYASHFICVKSRLFSIQNILTFFKKSEL